MKTKLSFCFLCALVMAGSVALAAPPRTVNVQGKLKMLSGRLVTDGSYDMIFSIHESATAPAALWTETWDASTAKVPVENGIYSISLGAHTPLGLAFDRPYWLSVQIKGSAGFETMVPRYPLTPSAAAARAIDADTLQGVLPASFTDASLVNTGRFTAVQVPGLDAAKIVSGAVATDRVPNLNASTFTSGEFDPDRIPALDAAKIATGHVVADRIPGLDASEFVSGTLNTNRVPGLAADRITAGQVSSNRIEDLDADKFVSGVFHPDRIPGVDGASIVSGTFDPDRIPDLDASVFTTGVLDQALVPGLDASKFVSGQLDIERLPALVQDATIKDVLDIIQAQFKSYNHMNLEYEEYTGILIHSNAVTINESVPTDPKITSWASLLPDFKTYVNHYWDSNDNRDKVGVTYIKQNDNYQFARVDLPTLAVEKTAQVSANDLPALDVASPPHNNESETYRYYRHTRRFLGPILELSSGDLVMTRQIDYDQEIGTQMSGTSYIKTYFTGTKYDENGTKVEDFETPQILNWTYGIGGSDDSDCYTYAPTQWGRIATGGKDYLCALSHKLQKKDDRDNDDFDYDRWYMHIVEVAPGGYTGRSRQICSLYSRDVRDSYDDDNGTRSPGMVHYVNNHAYCSVEYYYQYDKDDSTYEKVNQGYYVRKVNPVNGASTDVRSYTTGAQSYTYSAGQRFYRMETPGSVALGAYKYSRRTNSTRREAVLHWEVYDIDKEFAQHSANKRPTSGDSSLADELKFQAAGDNWYHIGAQWGAYPSGGTPPRWYYWMYEAKTNVFYQLPFSRVSPYHAEPCTAVSASTGNARDANDKLYLVSSSGIQGGANEYVLRSRSLGFEFPAPPKRLVVLPDNNVPLIAREKDWKEQFFYWSDDGWATEHGPDPMGEMVILDPEPTNRVLKIRVALRNNAVIDSLRMDRMAVWYATN